MTSLWEVIIVPPGASLCFLQASIEVSSIFGLVSRSCHNPGLNLDLFQRFMSFYYYLFVHESNIIRAATWTQDGVDQGCPIPCLRAGVLNVFQPTCH